jgi:uncharacterized membrane protein (UPF0127 family)
MTQRYELDGWKRTKGVSAETSPPPDALQPTLPSAFHGRYNDGNESAILQSISLGRRTGGILDTRTPLFCTTLAAFPAWVPLSARLENGTRDETIARIRESNTLSPTLQDDRLLDCERTDHYDAFMCDKPAALLALYAVVVAGLLWGEVPACRAADSELISIQTPSGAIIKAEIADTPLKRSVGLMYRDHLKKDHGMLFFFSQPQAWTFWMKNTKIALDLIWIDGKKRVTHIERYVPICTKSDDSCPQYRPNSDDAVYVLEIAGGTVDGYQIEKGTKLQFGQR